MKNKTLIRLMLVAACIMHAIPHSFANQAAYQSLEKKIDSLVALSIREGQPGGTIGITKKGEVIFQKAFGLADLENNVPNTTETAFNLASVAKQFTAFAILLLEEEGKLSLDDEIHRHIPKLPDYGEKITIRNLLHHTSGIASTDNLLLFAGRSLDGPWSQEQELNLIYRYPDLNFKPGEQHLYSNAGYSLLAEIIEKASGTTYDDYLQQKIFGPLQMTTTFVLDHPDKNIPNRAFGYSKEDEEFVRTKDGETIYGATNIYTSAKDLSRWGNNFFNPRVGSRKIMHRIFNPDHVLNTGDTVNYSYGLVVSSYKGVKRVSHSGGDLGYRSQFLLFPEQEVVVYAAFNTDAIHSGNLVYTIVDWLLEEHFEDKKPGERMAVDLDPEKLKKFEGSYQMPDGLNMSFEVKRDTFWLDIPGAPPFQVFAEDETRFFLKAFDAQITFVVEENGQVNSMIWHQAGGDHPAPLIGETKMPDAETLAGYAGIYYHEALEVEYPVRFEDGELIIQTPDNFKRYLNIEQLNLSPMGDDRFYSRIGVVKFTRNQQEKVNGFRFVDVGRLKNVGFVKTR